LTGLKPNGAKVDGRFNDYHHSGHAYDETSVVWCCSLVKLYFGGNYQRKQAAVAVQYNQLCLDNNKLGYYSLCPSTWPS